MHGRPRVRTTAEQEAAKRAEREEKLKKYLSVRDELQEIRDSSSLQNPKLFELSERLLRANSDLSSVWNLRKAALLRTLQSAGEEEKESCRQSFVDELRLTLECLQHNPKSYSVWQHRCWTLDTMPSPDWVDEIRLVERQLAAPAPGPNAPERNFHCWDYRRWLIARMPERSTEEELNFAESKLTENFSNFSAWHYKSRLLPSVCPPAEGETGPVEVGRAAEELDTVRSAYFLDPNDHSAWFYHRWLLEPAASVNKKCCTPGLRFMLADRCENRLILVLDAPVEVGVLNGMDVRLGDSLEHTKFKWNAPVISTCKGSHVWWTELPECRALNITLSYPVCPSVWKLTLKQGQTESLVRVEIPVEKMFVARRSPEEMELLRNERESLQELLDMEKMENKWALMRLVSLEHQLDPVNCRERVEPLIERLINVDNLRIKLYLDLRSRLRIEEVLRRSFSQNTRVLDLRNLGLTRLAHLDWMVLLTKLDLSDNELTDLPVEMSYLQCLCTLTLSRNRLHSLKGVEQLDGLRTLDVARNCLADFSALKPAFHCTKLQSLNVENNPVAKLDFTRQMKDILGCQSITHCVSIYK